MFTSATSAARQACQSWPTRASSATTSARPCGSRLRTDASCETSTRRIKRIKPPSPSSANGTDALLPVEALAARRQGRGDVGWGDDLSGFGGARPFADVQSLLPILQFRHGRIPRLSTKELGAVSHAAITDAD